MYENSSLSNPVEAGSAKVQRVDAAAAASFRHLDGKTRIGRLYQQGSAKIRFPRVHRKDKEAVLINTAGGLTGGDRIEWKLDFGTGARGCISTQACEKAYRSAYGAASMSTRIQLASQAVCHWLPQETILFDGSSLNRNMQVDMDGTSELLVVESIVLGRAAMGEKVNTIHFNDRWRIRRGGELVHAENLLLQDAAGSAARMSGNRAVASLVYLGPTETEACQSLAEKLRRVCPGHVSGFSGFAGKVTGRIMARDSYKLREALIPVLKELSGQELPRVWRI